MKNALKVFGISALVFFIATLTAGIFTPNPLYVGVGIATGFLIIYLISSKKLTKQNSKTK